MTVAFFSKFASLAQLARARDLYSRGRWFESDKRLKDEKVNSFRKIDGSSFFA